MNGDPRFPLVVWLLMALALSVFLFLTS